jgi:hypothetical protein
LTEEGPTFLSGIPLQPGVTLLVAASRRIAPEDIAAIRLAAAPLIDLLTNSLLIEPRERGDPP